MACLSGPGAMASMKSSSNSCSYICRISKKTSAKESLSPASFKAQTLQNGPVQVYVAAVIAGGFGNAVVAEKVLCRSRLLSSCIQDSIQKCREMLRCVALSRNLRCISLEDPKHSCLPPTSLYGTDDFDKKTFGANMGKPCPHRKTPVDRGAPHAMLRRSLMYMRA